MPYSPIERIARKLSVVANEEIEFAPPWWSEDGDQPGDTILVSEDKKALYRRQAQAVLEEMRDPSDLMGLGLRKMQGDQYKPGSHSAADIWRAMIDAALVEVEPE